MLETRTESGSQPRGARTQSERQRGSPSPQGGQAGRHHGPSEGDVRPLGRHRPAGSPAAATMDSPFTDRRPRVTGRRAQGRAGLPRRWGHRGRVQGAGPALRAGGRGRGRGFGITGPGAGAGGARGPGQQLSPRLDIQGGRGRRRPPWLALGGGPGEQLQQPLSLFLEKRKKHESRRHGSVAAVSSSDVSFRGAPVGVWGLWVWIPGAVCSPALGLPRTCLGIFPSSGHSTAHRHPPRRR